MASQVALEVKNSLANAGDIRDVGSVPDSGRSPGGGQSNPLQYARLEDPVDRRAWRATVHGVAESDMTEVTYNAHTVSLNSVPSISHSTLYSEAISQSVLYK